MLSKCGKSPDKAGKKKGRKEPGAQIGWAFVRAEAETWIDKSSQSRQQALFDFTSQVAFSAQRIIHLPPYCTSFPRNALRRLHHLPSPILQLRSFLLIQARAY